MRTIPYSVTITATNADNSTATTSFNVSFTDVAPTVSANSAAVSALENAAATNTGAWSDYDDTVTLSASSGTLTYTPGQSGSWSWSGTGDEDHPYSVTITATNADNSTATTSFNVSFTDVAPTVSANSAAVSILENAAATNTGAGRTTTTRSPSCLQRHLDLHAGPKRLLELVGHRR